MSRYTALSDIDYFDEPFNKPEPCATRGCEGVCDNPSSIWCYDCRTAELEARADANARHQRELAAAQAHSDPASVGAIARTAGSQHEPPPRETAPRFFVVTPGGSK